MQTKLSRATQARRLKGSAYMALFSEQLLRGIQSLQNHQQIPRASSMSSQVHLQATISPTSTAVKITSTSIDTVVFPPPKGPSYNSELAMALNKHLFGKKSTPTALNEHFFGKKHKPIARIMAPVNSGDDQTYRSRLAQMNQRLANKPAATANTTNPVIGDAAAAPNWMPKTAMAKPRKSAVVPNRMHFFSNPRIAKYAPLEGLGQTVNGEFVDTPGRYQGYGTRIPYASFVKQYAQPVQEVEYKDVPGRYQGYGTRIPYASFCSQYSGASFTVKGESDYSVRAQFD